MKNKRIIFITVVTSSIFAAIHFQQAIITATTNEPLTFGSAPSRILSKSLPTRTSLSNVEDASNRNTSLIFDIISIGSNTRTEYQDAQQRSFGSHRSVRHFFRITEDDDIDKSCYQRLTNNDTYIIAQQCRSRRAEQHQFVMKYLRTCYAKADWLMKKPNPAGWMCAQRRPVHGFAKAIDFYRSHNETLPDFIIIMDDDSYYDMEKVSKYMKEQSGASLAIAGCMVRSPIYLINFTFPFGGWGLTFSKQTLENFMRRIRCRSEAQVDDFLESTCKALRANQIGERYVFRKGISLSDLMQAFVSWQPFTEFKNWTYGFCFHSDWIWGYFTNFYPVSIHDTNPFFRDVPHARLMGYNGSVLYGGAKQRRFLANRKQCNHDREHCDAKAHICHYQTPERMLDLTKQARQLHPSRFRVLQV